MSTIRVAKRQRFAVVDRRAIRDERLSWAARGLLVWALDQPDDYEFSREQIATQAPEGETAVRRILKELTDAGYLVRERHRNDDGTFRTETTLYEVPPLVGNPPPDDPPVENPPVRDGRPNDSFATQKAAPPIRAANGSAPPPLWRQALEPRLPKRGQRSFDLVASYSGAWDQLETTVSDEEQLARQHVPLVADFIERVIGERLPNDERAKVAKLVRKHGKATLLGYDQALGATKDDNPHAWFRYARGVINRFIAEQEGAMT